MSCKEQLLLIYLLKESKMQIRRKLVYFYYISHERVVILVSNKWKRHSNFHCCRLL